MHFAIKFSISEDIEFALLSLPLVTWLHSGGNYSSRHDLWHYNIMAFLSKTSKNLCNLKLYYSQSCIDY